MLVYFPRCPARRSDPDDADYLNLQSADFHMSVAFRRGVIIRHGSAAERARRRFTESLAAQRGGRLDLGYHLRLKDGGNGASDVNHAILLGLSEPHPSRWQRLASPT